MTNRTDLETKNIDYDMCHDDIANALKMGKAILCKVWDYNKSASKNEWVVAYLLMQEKPYITELYSYIHAEPVISGYKVKNINDLKETLINNGYTYDPEYNSWRDTEGIDTVTDEMFTQCGKRVKMINGYWRSNGFIFEEEWLDKIGED
jgi:hypothetical protein